METSIRDAAPARRRSACTVADASRGLRTACSILAAGILWLSIQPLASAQILSGPFVKDTLYAGDYEVLPAIWQGPALGKQQSEITATFVFHYEGLVPQEARAAFEHAGEIWGRHLQSSVPIHVLVKWEALGDNVLGTAGPRLVANWRTNMQWRNTWYPTAIAESMENQDFTGVDDQGNPVPDIESTFNSSFPNWYFGLDGNVPPNKYDFVSVVMHELGHGLGFTGSFDIEDGDGDASSRDCPNTDTAGLGCWGLPTTSDGRLFPFIYDRFTEDGNEVALLNATTYPNPSTAIASALQSGTIYFNGPASKAINFNGRVRLFAPATFESGSSYSHLDEATFSWFDDNPNRLMTPEFGRGEVIRSPGPVTCGIMQDMGWSLGPDCMLLVGTDLLEPGELFTLEGFGPNPFSDKAEATLTVDSQQTVRVEVFDVTGRLLATLLDQNVAAQQPVRIVLLGDRAWASGVYFVRIMGETFSKTQPVVFVR